MAAKKTLANGATSREERVVKLTLHLDLKVKVSAALGDTGRAFNTDVFLSEAVPVTLTLRGNQTAEEARDSVLEALWEGASFHDMRLLNARFEEPGEVHA
jgi:hypothetical protein